MDNRDIIFLMEDNTLLQEQLKETLEKNEEIKNRQITVFSSSSIELANVSYDALKLRIACLVCDSNMSSIGLDGGLREESEGGLFSGWLWLKEKIKDDETLAERALLYSAYCDELQGVIRQNSTLRIIPCIRKKTISSLENEEIIKEIVRIIKGG